MKPEKTPLREKTIGVAGLGQMGFPMACRIQQAGYQVLGHDIVRKHLDDPIPLEFDPQKFARSCELVLSQSFAMKPRIWNFALGNRQFLNRIKGLRDLSSRPPFLRDSFLK